MGHAQVRLELFKAPAALFGSMAGHEQAVGLHDTGLYKNSLEILSIFFLFSEIYLLHLDVKYLLCFFSPGLEECYL